MTTDETVPPTSTAVRAAGGVVLRGDEPEVLVVHRPGHADWSLPKGKLDPGETWQQAAVREVHEETGVTARLGVELSPTHYHDADGRPKVVRWWRMHVVGDAPRDADAEVDVVRWLPLDEARERLTYPSDRERLEEALDVADHRVVLVVRHSHAGDRQAWDGDDHRRPLSPEGLAQTTAMVSLLAPYHVTRVLSSPYVRCLQTAEPLARARGLQVAVEDRLAEGTAPETAWRVLADAGTGTMLSSHGDVIGSMVERLQDLGVVDGRARWPKGSSWVVEVDAAGRPRATDHLPAPG